MKYKGTHELRYVNMCLDSEFVNQNIADSSIDEFY